MLQGPRAVDHPLAGLEDPYMEDMEDPVCLHGISRRL